MRRVLWTAAIAAAVSAFSAPDFGRAAVNDTTSSSAAGTVNAVSLSRASGLAEVVIGATGEFEVDDFSLQAPHRIVIDLQPATLKLTPAIYDGIVRGGITNVRVSQFKNNVVRVVLDLDRQREYDVSREDGSIRVSLPASEDFEPWSLGAQPRVAPSRPAPAAPVASARVATPPPVDEVIAEPVQQAGGRITISVRDTDLRDVLGIFAERSGRSIVTSLSNYRVTADLNDLPWQTALKAILDTYGLAAVEDPQSRVIRVTTNAEVVAQRAFEPVVSVRLPLNYARAAELATTITSLLSPDCGSATPVPVIGGAPPAGGDAAAGAAAAPPMTTAAPPPGSPTACLTRGRVVSEPVTNTLVIYETASRIDSLVAYAKSFDQKPQQVNIKAQIISINRTNTSKLGVSYDLGSPDAFFNSLAPRSTTGAATEFQVTLGGDAFAGVANATRTHGADAAINLLYNATIGNFSLTSFIDALSQEQLSDIQAVPSVNTVDRRPATLFVGNQVSFLLTPPTAAGAIQSQPPVLRELDVGIMLNVTPSVSANRTIRLAITAEQSSFLTITVAGPNTSRRNVTNEAIVNDGETAVISGLTQKQISKTRRGIPMLMNLPLLGRLFSETEEVETTDDLLILITARILDDPIPAPPGR